MTNDRSKKSASEPLTMKRLCEARESGKVDPFDRTHVKRQLEAEGQKRVESFPFDKLFVDALCRSFGADYTSSGWWRMSPTKAGGMLWVRLVADTSPWNPVDDRVVQLCGEAGEFHLVVTWDTSRAGFRTKGSYPGADEEQALSTVLESAYGVRGSYYTQQFHGAGSPRARDAIKLIDSSYSNAELVDLSLSRLLVNCWLAPWIGRQPMDIDAICLAKDALLFFEFKRKYPTRAGRLSLDMFPHMDFARWLQKRGLHLNNVVLCDPAWDKDTSPLYLLTEKSGAENHARWLGKVVDVEAESGSASTSGADSGMTKGFRNQATFSVDSYALIGKGMTPPDMNQFASSLETFDYATLDDLWEARDAARLALGL